MTEFDRELNASLERARRYILNPRVRSGESQMQLSRDAAPQGRSEVKGVSGVILSALWYSLVVFVVILVASIFSAFWGRRD